MNSRPKTENPPVRAIHNDSPMQETGDGEPGSRRVSVSVSDVLGVASLIKQADIYALMEGEGFAKARLWEEEGRLHLEAATAPYLSLRRFIELQGSFLNGTLADFLHVWKQLASAMQRLHEAGLTHGHLTTHNVFIDPQTQQIFISDFSHAFFWREATLFIPHHQYATSLDFQFVSPEQWERQESPQVILDYRTDLYNVGLILYEIVSGRPPFANFSSRQELQIAHCEIATPPLSLQLERSTWEESSVLSCIIHKLLEKNPGRRYPTVASAWWDSERLSRLCPREATHFRAQSYIRQQGDMLSVFDINEAATIPEMNVQHGPVIRKLGLAKPRSFMKVPAGVFGIHRLVDDVVQQYEESIGSKKCTVIFIEGVSGLGKSTLAKICASKIRVIKSRATEAGTEIYASSTCVKTSGGIVARGKFEQLVGYVPYSAIRMLLADILENCLEIFGKEAVQDVIRRSMNAFSIHIFTEQLLPAMNQLFDLNLRVTILSASENRVRLEDAFSRWLYAISTLTAPFPITLILDDLQWATETCISLLRSVTRSLNSLVFLFVHRPTKGVTGSWPIHELHEEYRASNTVHFHHIELPGLSLEHTKSLLLDMMGSNHSTEQLVDTIHEKGGGNPFFITQAVSQLYDAKLLTYQPEKECWEYDHERISQMANNVVDLVNEEITTFNAPLKRLLQIASCTDSHFDLNLLSIVSRQSTYDIVRIIRSAVYIGFIQEVRDSDCVRSTTYRFVHDRIQEGFYKSMPDEKKLQTHFEIGTLLVKNIRGTPISSLTNNTLYNIAKNLNLGQHLVHDPTLQRTLLEINLLVSERSVETGSFQQAASSAEFNHKLLLRMVHGDEETIWREHKQAGLKIFRTLCECKYLLGDLDASEQAYRVVSTHSDSFAEKVELGQLRMRHFNTSGHLAPSIEIGLELLNLQGANLSLHMEPSAFSEALSYMWQLINERGGISCFDEMPRVADQEIILFHRIAAISMPTSYLCGDFILHNMISVLGTTKCLEKGIVTCTLGILLGFLSITLHGCSPSIESTQICRMGWKIACEYEDPFSTANAGLCAITMQYMDDSSSLKTVESIYTASRLAALQVHDINTFSYIECVRLWNCDFMEDPLESLLAKSFDAFKTISSYKKHGAIACTQGAYFAAHLLVFGKLPDPLEELPFMEDDQISQQSAGLINSNHMMLLRSYFLLRDYEKAEEQYELLVNTKHSSMGVAILYSFEFWGTLLVVGLDSKSKQEKKESVQNALEVFRPCVAVCPSYFHSKVLVLEAELMRLEEHPEQVEEVMQQYELAIQSAEKRELWASCGIITERYVSFCRVQNLFCLEKSLLEKAEEYYVRWGAIAVSQLLEEDTMHCSSDTNATRVAPASITSKTVQEKSLEQLSRLLSQGQDFPGMLRLVADILWLGAKAEKGYIFILSDEVVLTLFEWNAEEKNMYPLTQSNNSTPRPLSELAHKIPQTIIEHVCTVGESSQVFIDRKLSEYMDKSHIKTIACLPLKKKAHVFGALFIENDDACNAFQNYRTLIESVTEHLSILVEYHCLASNLDHLLQRVRRKNVRLEHLNRLKDHFVRTISRELCSPLRVILNITKDLKLSPIDHEQRQILDMISSSASGLLLIINDILDFQACQRNELQLEIVQFNLQQILDECVMINRAKPSVSLTLDLGPLINRKDLIVEGDKHHLKQVLSNLISNAVKFTESGNVTVRCYLEGRINERILPVQTMIRFAVMDTGIGISKSRQSDLFKAFTQLDSSTKRKHSGTGLGLALSQLIIKKMSKKKSEIICRSEEGKGSTFSFALPMTVVDVINRNTLPPVLENFVDGYDLIVITNNNVTAQTLFDEGSRYDLEVSIFHSTHEFMRNASAINMHKKNLILIESSFYEEGMRFHPKDEVVLLVNSYRLPLSEPRTDFVSAVVYCPLSQGALGRLLTELYNRTLRISSPHPTLPKAFSLSSLPPRNK